MPTPQKDLSGVATPSLNFLASNPLLNEPVPPPDTPGKEPEKLDPVESDRQAIPPCPAPATPSPSTRVADEGPIDRTPKSAKKDSVRVNAEVDKITVRPFILWAAEVFR